MKKTKIFGEKLMELRKDRNLSRREFAEKLGINEFTLRGYELEGREPKYDLLVKISDFFHISIDDLLKEKTVRVKWLIAVDDNSYEDETTAYEPTYNFSPEMEDAIRQNRTIDFVSMFYQFLQTQSFSRDFSQDDQDQFYNLFSPKKSTEINVFCNSDNDNTQMILNFKIIHIHDKDFADQ